MRIGLALVLVLVVGLGVKAIKSPPKPGVAQALAAPGSAPTAPALSTEHKLQFQVLMQRLEIARLKSDAAQAEFTAAQREAAALVEQTKIAGYDLDLQSFTYVRTPTPAAAPPVSK
jgi:hypothetical protein